MDNYDTTPYDPFAASRTTLPDGSTRYSPDGGQTFVVDKWDETRRGTVRAYQDASGNPIGAPEFLPAGNLSAGRSALRAIGVLGGAALGANALMGAGLGAGGGAAPAAAGGGGGAAPAVAAAGGAAAPAAAGGAMAAGASGLTWAAPLISAGVGGLASMQAARTQAQATQQAAQTQRDIFNQQVALNEPWRQAGLNALQRMQSGDIGLTQDPSYTFRFNEGLRALERLRAAGGKMYSGGTARAATRFGQDMASTEYGNAWNRLASLAGIGQTATGAQTGAAGTYGARAGDLTTSGAAARASGYMGGANALSQALSQMQQQAQFNQLMNLYGPRQQQQQTAPQAPAPTMPQNVYSPFLVPQET